MSSPQRDGDPVKLSGGVLGDLCFEWAEDRYCHRWEFSQDPDASVASIESGNNEAWPLSPPLQQIHRQSFGDGREVIFGVGMAGRGHWSASYTLVPELGCWIVELACRSPIAPERLICSYELDKHWASSPSDAQPIGAQRTLGAEQQVQLEAIAPTTIAESQSQTVRFLPASLATSASTTQWAFRLQLKNV